MTEVADLLVTYEKLLGHELPALSARSEDHAEVPVALPHGGTVWQGVIDRFYCAGGVWYLEDYKTDRVVAPEHYTFQLALYARVLEQVRGITPVVQLVYLRTAQIVRVPPAVLEAAFRRNAHSQLDGFATDSPSPHRPLCRNRNVAAYWAVGRVP